MFRCGGRPGTGPDPDRLRSSDFIGECWRSALVGSDQISDEVVTAGQGPSVQSGALGNRQRASGSCLVKRANLDPKGLIGFTGLLEHVSESEITFHVQNLVLILWSGLKSAPEI